MASFLQADFRVRCATAEQPPSVEHERILSIAYGMVFVWPIGVPLVIAALLWRAEERCARSPLRWPPKNA